MSGDTPEDHETDGEERPARKDSTRDGGHSARQEEQADCGHPQGQTGDEQTAPGRHCRYGRKQPAGRSAGIMLADPQASSG